MNILGIDIGGTSIKGAVVNEKGEVCSDVFSLPVPKGEDQNITMKNLINISINTIENFGQEVSGIGIGIPGAIDSTKGIVTFSNNLKWKNLKIVEIFKKSFNLPIKITNDANAASLGEARFGAGKDAEIMIMFTLGTGVGGGIVINGKLFEGKDGRGAELGHTTLIMDGLQCSCGRKGCMEMYASATALIRMTKEEIIKDKDSIIWNEIKDINEINGRHAFDAMKKGDKTGERIVKMYVKNLSEGILNYCNIFRPDVIVLSGGIAKEGKFLTDMIEDYLEEHEYGYPTSPASKVRTAKLGYNSGIIGAASLLLD